MPTETPLAQELQVYSQRRQDLLQKYERQFIVICGEEILAAFSSESDAYEAALTRWGNRPFLIRRVSSEDPEIRYPALSVGMISHAHS